MEQALAVINRMVADKVIAGYAIGGAVAAIFYIEPINTEDVDVFFYVEAEAPELMILAPLYEYLTACGYQASGDAVSIEGWRVQFLPVFNLLVEEAVIKARDFTVGATPVRVMHAEHLMAIMLQTGRGKDYARLNMFIEVGAFDESRLERILKRYDLIDKWRALRKG